VFVKTFQSQWNEFEDDAGRWQTVILIEDWTEDLWLEEERGTNRRMQRTTIHEVGHGWDGNHDCGVPPRHPDGFEYWEPFVALHEESDPADPEYDRDFVSDYGATHVDEDWCTCWEMTFGYMRRDYTTDPSERLRQKLAIVDEFFARFASPRSEMKLLSLSSFASAAAESDDGEAKTALVAGDLLGKLYFDA
jgi:hypothetical protein